MSTYKERIVGWPGIGWRRKPENRESVNSWVGVGWQEQYPKVSTITIDWPPGAFESAVQLSKTLASKIDPEIGFLSIALLTALGFTANSYVLSPLLGNRSVVIPEQTAAAIMGSVTTPQVTDEPPALVVPTPISSWFNPETDQKRDDRIHYVKGEYHLYYPSSWSKEDHDSTQIFSGGSIALRIEKRVGSLEKELAKILSNLNINPEDTTIAGFMAKKVSYTSLGTKVDVYWVKTPDVVWEFSVFRPESTSQDQEKVIERILYSITFINK